MTHPSEPQATSEARVALVVGGGRGIGAASARALAADGLRVIVADRDAESAAAVATSLGGNHAALPLDVTDEAAVDRAFDDVAAAHGPVSVLVNTAAISPFAPDGGMLRIAETSVETWQQVIDINLLGTFLLCRAFLRRAEAVPAHGRVVTLSSAAGQIGGYRSCGAYIASKAGVIGFTKGLARELSPFGITANCVAPGLIETPMLRQSLHPQDDAKAGEAVPLGRIGSAEEVASAVRYLVSPQAAYVTGAVINVNGGYHMA